MSSSSNDLGIILFTFPESVYGRRIVRYLNLRNIPFTQIRVPPRIPRPILSERLGIQYRRIPILSIGRDIYIDSRLIIKKLESLGDPDSRLAANRVSSFERGLLDILEEFIIDGGPFWRTAGLIPSDSGLMLDPKWRQDRVDGSGGAFTVEALEANRSWCLSQMRIYFSMFEKILSDGREFVFGGEEPGMAEIHAGWVFEWVVHLVMGVEGRYAAKEDLRRVLGEEKFPRVWAWVRRFMEVDEVAAKRNESGLLEGVSAEAEIVDRILNAQMPPESGDELAFDEDDVLGLKRGERISIAPTDFGFTHKDVGSLVGLTENEVVIESPVPGDQGILRLHYPRINFKILPVP